MIDRKSNVILSEEFLCHIRSNPDLYKKLFVFMKRPIDDALLTNFSNFLCELHKLKYLALKGAAFNEVAIGVIFNSLQSNQTIQHLHIENMVLSEISMKNVITMLSKKHLTSLTINAINLKAEMMESLFAALETTKSVRMLSLSKNWINDEAIEVAAPFLACSKVSSLDLSSNRMTEKSAQNIANIIIGNKFLTTLNLNGNYIHHGLPYLANAIGSSKTLEILHLSNTGATVIGVSSICSALRKNNSVCVIDFIDNLLAPKAIKDLNIATCNITRLVDVAYEKMSSKAAYAILVRRKSVSILADKWIEYKDNGKAITEGLFELMSSYKIAVKFVLGHTPISRQDLAKRFLSDYRCLKDRIKKQNETPKEEQMDIDIG